jgi:F0F1-type ATP synthase gamma subunit
MRNHPEKPEFKVIVVGRKGRDYLRRLHIPILKEYTDAEDFASYKRAQEIASIVTPGFVEGSIDEVSIVTPISIRRKSKAQRFIDCSQSLRRKRKQPINPVG